MLIARGHSGNKLGKPLEKARLASQIGRRSNPVISPKSSEIHYNRSKGVLQNAALLV
jgi:hypothetical protein